MSSQLKSWFFSTIRDINSRGKYVNFNDGGEPDQVTFSSLMDTTVLKKVGSTYQDQADYVAVNAESDVKFTTADNLPIIEDSIDGAITLDVTAATTNSEKIKYKINPHFVSDIEQIGPTTRATNVFVSPDNLPRVEVEIVGTPIEGQGPLVVGNVISSDFNFTHNYEIFKLRLNVLTSSFISHSGVLLSTVLNTLRTDVDAKVSDAELASEVSDLNISIATKAAKVTPVVGIGGNGTKVTVNGEGIVTHVNKANASDLKNDSSVAGSTIRDALNNLSSLTSSPSLAIIVPLESNEIVSFTALNATKHIVDTTSGSIVATLPLDVTSINGDMVIVSKDSADVNTVTVKNESLDTLIVLRHIDDNALFHFSGGKWSYLGVPSIITQTVTNGITDKVPSEDAVFDAIENAKGFIKDAVNKIAGETLEVDKINLVNVTVDTTFTLPTASLAYKGKVLIVKLDNNPNSNLTISGAAYGTVILTEYRDSVIFSCSEINTSGVYHWFEVSKSVDLITQTITDGVTDKSPSEDAVFDAIYQKGLINSTYWVNAYGTEGNFDLLVDAYNNVGYTDAEGAITVYLPSFLTPVHNKTIIIQGHRFNDGLTTVNISIPGLQQDGGALEGTFTEVITHINQVVTIQANYYGWHVISHTNQAPDLSPYALLASSISDGDTTHSPDGNAVFDALALKESVITKNALSTPLVWTSANGVASFQPIPVLGDLTYYLTNTASDVATYYKQTTTPQVALTSLPFASVTNGQLLATFISEPNNPNRTSIPDGQYLNHLHLGKTGGTKDLQVRSEIWETTSAGVDIVKLADLGPSTILVGSGSTEYIIGYNTIEKTLSAVTSRIATKIYAVVGASGSAPSISIFQGDGSDSRSNLPAPVMDATNYVPYEGMLNDLTTGTKDIIYSNATVSTPTFFDSAKKFISATSQLWGTWVQTWANKATPVDADTLPFYNSASTFVGVKSTLLNFWTAYLLPKITTILINYKYQYSGTQGSRLSATTFNGMEWYQTDGVVGLYLYKTSVWVLLGATSNIRQVDVQLFNYALQQDVSYVDEGTITTFINLNNQLASATYQKFTYSTGTWTGGSITNITFTAGVSTVSIAMAQYDFIRVVGVLAGANTQAVLSIKTTIS
jgi:hypothetical protein